MVIVRVSPWTSRGRYFGVNRRVFSDGIQSFLRAPRFEDMHATLPLKWTFWGTRRDAFNTFIANTLECARHFHRIAYTSKRMESANKGTRGGSRCRILSLAEGPVTEIRDSGSVVSRSLSPYPFSFHFCPFFLLSFFFLFCLLSHFVHTVSLLFTDIRGLRC